MAGPFHVFVDGASAAGPDGLRALADAMSQRYGLPAGDLVTRMTAGRFRVKSNCDREDADALVAELVAMGARCSIDDTRTATAPAAAGAPATARPSSSSLGPPLAAPAVARTTSGSQQFQSGLSAAFSGPIDTTNLGALSGNDQPLSLASLDGEPEAGTADMGGAFAAPSPPPLPPPPKARPPGTTAAPASKPAAPPPVAGASAAKPRPILPPGTSPSNVMIKSKAPVAPKPGELIDMFAPPDEAEANLKVELAPDQIAHQARKRATTPPATAALDGGPGAPNRYARTSTSPVQTQPAAERYRPRGRLGPLGEETVRFAVGVFVCVLLGFIPAHVVASMRERTAFAAIDSKVKAVQGSVETVSDYQALDSMRIEQLAKKHAERRSIAIGSMLIWAFAGAAIAYVWFRRVPWDELDRPV